MAFQVRRHAPLVTGPRLRSAKKHGRIGEAEGIRRSAFLRRRNSTLCRGRRGRYFYLLLGLAVAEYVMIPTAFM